MSKEVVEAKKQELVNQEMMAAWGDTDVSAGDIVIPKILLMQGLSEAVAEEKAKMGDYLDSLTGTVIGSHKKPIEVVPFHLERIWIHSKKEGGDFVFDSITTAHGPNEYEYLQVQDGVEWKHEYCMNFYVLRPEDMALPYVLSFKGTSRKAGKALATQMFVKNKMAGKIPPAFVMELGAHKESNDKGTYYVWDVTVKRESSKEEVSTAFDWFKTVNAGGVKTHETESSVSSAADEARF
jgi:hypothetical protein